MMLSIRVRLLLGFMVTLILSILPLPSVMSAFKPPWVLLLVLYIKFYLPESFSLVALLLMGLVLDVLLSSVIGEHSFALVLMTWIASAKSRRFQFFSMMQQLFLIGFFCLCYQFVISLIDGLLGFNYSLYKPFAGAMLGLFFWPWIRLIGEDLLLKGLVFR